MDKFRRLYFWSVYQITDGGKITNTKGYNNFKKLFQAFQIYKLTIIFKVNNVVQ